MLTILIEFLTSHNFNVNPFMMLHIVKFLNHIISKPFFLRLKFFVHCFERLAQIFLNTINSYKKQLQRNRCSLWFLCTGFYIVRGVKKQVTKTAKFLFKQSLLFSWTLWMKKKFPREHLRSRGWWSPVTWWRNTDIEKRIGWNIS